MKIVSLACPDEKSKIARDVLESLPEWFGIEESREEYIKTCRELPFWAAFSGDIPIGFVCLKATSRHCAEICVMGVKKDFHRAGAGRALCLALENYARENGFSFLQVKTVQMGRYPEYDITNRFYISMGFSELECFPTLWDEANPCQIYVKYIA